MGYGGPRCVASRQDRLPTRRIPRRLHRPPDSRRSLMPDEAKIAPIPTSYAVAAAQVQAAQESLFENTDDLPTWPWPDVTSLCGKPLPGDLPVVGARPENGKPRLMVTLLDSLARAGSPTLYSGAGSEGPPKDSRKQWAALRLGFPAYLVLENRWTELPTGARDAVYAELEDQASGDHKLAHFAEVGERLTPKAPVTAL